MGGLVSEPCGVIQDLGKRERQGEKEVEHRTPHEVYYVDRKPIAKMVLECEYSHGVFFFLKSICIPIPDADRDLSA